MRTKKFSTSVLLFVAMFGTPAIADTVSLQDPQQPPPAADNTATNQRDRDNSAMTADNQGTSSSDRTTTKQIRAAIHGDKSLSMYAHNIKIITRNGKVTLKGPVRSEDEKANIAAKAVAIAGKDNVDNQIEVVPPKQ